METTSERAQSTAAEPPVASPGNLETVNTESAERRQERMDWWFRRISQWFVVGGTATAGLFFLSFLVWHTIHPVPAAGWMVTVLNDHYAATIGVPLSAITAFCVVTLLHVISKGDIEFSFLGFTLKGAAGPVILWIMCFLAVVLGFELLWDNAN